MLTCEAPSNDRLDCDDDDGDDGGDGLMRVSLSQLRVSCCR